MGSAIKVLIGLGVGGVAAYFGYKAYKQYKDEQEIEAARARLAAGGGAAGAGGFDLSKLTSLLPEGLDFGKLPWLDGGTEKKAAKTPAAAKVFTPPQTVAMTKPCVLQSVDTSGKKKAVTAKQLNQLLPASVIWQGQAIPTPSDAGKTGAALMDAQQDLVDYAVSKGWLELSPGASGLPRWVVRGAKQQTKMARAQAAACAKAFIVYEAYQGVSAL